MALRILNNLNVSNYDSRDYQHHTISSISHALKTSKNWGQNILLQVEGNAISCSQKLFNGIKVYPACISSQDSSSKVY